MSNPHSGDPPSFTPSASYRRTSYATVAAGTPDSPFRDSDSLSRAHSGTPTREGERTGNMSAVRSTHAPPGAGFHDERRPGTSGRSDGPAGASASWASDALGYGAGSGHEQHQAFFKPSYLQTSRYVQRLEQAYEAHLAELQEYANRHPTIKIPLSTNSSNVNLGKMPSAHSHRSPVQDVIERLAPPSAESELHPLPARWSEEDKMNGLEIMADGTEVRFNGVTKTSDEAAAVRSDSPMPKEVGIFYFEVTVLSRGKDGYIGVGFSGRKANLNRLPGWEGDSWAYHGDDGYVFSCSASGKAYGPRFGSQDVVGCGVNFRTGDAFFTKNGNYLGKAFSNIRNDRLYPSVGMKKPGEHLRINFGKTPFVFDIDTMMEEERRDVMADINSTNVSELHPPDDENALVHNLIGQYLAHEGYIATAKAFGADLQERQRAISDPSQTTQFTSDEEDIHANNRQRIRRSILDGDIDRALKYTSTYYPRIFEDEKNKDIYFRLRCRKFIEMIRRYSELSTAVSSPTTVTKSVDSLASNGHADVTEDDQDLDEPPDTQMELDDQLHREASRDHEEQPLPTDDIDMDASQELPPKLTFMKAEQVMNQAVRYGQELNAEFGKDPRPAIQSFLREIFAIVAYGNPSNSPMAHLFEVTGRAEIAEDVNGAVLVSLGKPSSAALEKLCAQTEALLDEAANKTGSAAALIHVREDFLRE
ncbi:hypothetical protein DOTSEDRAFT_70504 [Dothistroma septosporum NZE10]|uniref:Uncharacterized protein n=1 Tax=Dothistroma septosporum (strain NZE10 / CBS 128990) TaxID=675120 RepID=N1PVY4_DOTSN|nr:hypothetical protein DOTSEDRAFT_70504 [Dothistroma septosporum NZE10]